MTLDFHDLPLGLLALIVFFSRVPDVSIAWYEDSLFMGYPRRSFGGGGGKHAGEDCAWFREGCSYYAIAAGVVRMVQGAGGDWGFLIVIEHLLESGDYVTAVYGHCAWDVLVKPGQIVKRGEKIGGQGLSTSVQNGGYGAHLHFGWSNPQKWLPDHVGGK